MFYSDNLLQHRSTNGGDVGDSVNTQSESITGYNKIMRSESLITDY